MSALFVEVAVVLPVIGTYYYRVPPELAEEVAVGRQILVPFGRRRLTGYILNISSQPPVGMEITIRDILQVSSTESYFTESTLPFYRWLSNYYLAPLGDVIQGVLPRGASTSTRRAAFVSKGGRAALNRSKATLEETAILSLLLEHPGLSLNQIRRRLPEPGVARICRTLGRRGLITWEDRVQEPRVKPRRLKVVRRNPSALDAAADDLKEKEREILDLLATGPRQLRKLKVQVGNGYYWIRKMADRGLVSVSLEEVYRDPMSPPIEESHPPHTHTVHQEQAIQQINQALERERFASFLLYGVTGSGKTEVYLAAAAAAMRLKRQSLVLVPEIALTARMEGLFRQHFQSRVAILHSGLGRGERRDEWVRVRRGEADVVVGARSALFAPLERLGLVVVDEEHDGSYKQERGFRYHGRDAAVMRAKLEEAVVIMGSATPALSSYHNALQGKFGLLNLPHRIDDRPLPKVTIIDMKYQKQTDLISVPLRQALADTLAVGKQALLLINRRGYANFLLCRRCGHVQHCHNCAVSLTWHRAGEKLRCHLCGLAMDVPPECPECNGTALKPFGFGTQRVEAEVKRFFPEARVSRMDRDTTRSKQAYRRLLNDLSSGRTDILVGTQMIAKGHDFPNITLVGVVSADIALQWPDFRAAENTFQVLTQVAGRAGRGESPGRVLVQTYNPEHYSIRFARTHDYTGFFEEEMAFRQELGYPPYRRLILFQLAGNVEEKTHQAAQRLGARFKELLHQRPDRLQELEMLGPVAAPLPRVKAKYRWQLLLKSRKSAPLLNAGRELMNWWQAELKGSGVSLSADVDPISLI
ncbi:MAG: primosomal protein N' [Syntrophobacterales bacterium]|jgi:primosomal protein N' (replication factor Y)